MDPGAGNPPPCLQGWEECNWLQALEGGIDTSHAPILHRTITPNTSRPGIPVQGPFVRGRAPLLEVDVTDYGYRYVGIRPLNDNKTYVRSYHFVMPFTQIRPQQLGRAMGGGDRTNIAGHIWVPIDDENCMVWNWMYSFGEEGLTEADRLERGNGNGPDYVETSGEFRSFRNKTNNRMIDHQVQKHETFTGIDGINTQDRAVQEGMGPTSTVPRSISGRPTARSSPPAGCCSMRSRRCRRAATRRGSTPAIIQRARSKKSFRATRPGARPCCPRCTPRTSRSRPNSRLKCSNAST